MKRIIIAIMAAAAVFASCTEKNMGSSDRGTLVLNVKSSGKMNDQNITFKSAGDGNINTDDFDVVITKKSGEEYRTFKLGEMPELLEMVPGSYVISVTSPDKLSAAWDQPIYGGEKEFAIVRDNVSNEEITCTVQNVKVSVKCTQNFLDEVTNYSIVVTTDDGSLTWNDTEVTEGKTGWFNAAPMKVYIKGYRQIDEEEVAELDFKIDDVAAADHIILNIDAKTTGSAVFEIKVDGSLNDKDVAVVVPDFPETPVDRPDTDPEPGETAPTMEWEGNEDFAPMPLAETMNVKINIKAEEGIKSFVVSVDSPVLNGVIGEMNGGSTDMDMINPSDGLKTLFSGNVLATVKLPYGDEVKNKSEVPFDISTLAPMILALGPEDGSEHIFTLKVEDNAGQKLEKACVFVYNAPAAK